jgi:hypothetical protein
MTTGGVPCYICDAPAVGACLRCGNFVCDAHRRRDRMSPLVLCDRCRESVASMRWGLAVFLMALLLAGALLVIYLAS